MTEVIAQQVTTETIPEIILWVTDIQKCRGEQKTGWLKFELGQWVVDVGTEFKVMTDDEFWSRYKLKSSAVFVPNDGGGDEV